jgi:RNA polymerase-binding transcription factor DksA
MNQEEFKVKLLKAKDDLELLLKEIEVDETDIKEISAEAAVEISDMADQFEERQNVYSQKEVILERLKRINNALKRIEIGSYGQCVKCAKEIEEMRLKIDPATETCRKCSLG